MSRLIYHGAFITFVQDGRRGYWEIEYRGQIRGRVPAVKRCGKADGGVTRASLKRAKGFIDEFKEHW